MIPQTTRILAFLNIDAMIILTALGDVAVRTEAVTSEQLIVLWCVIGGFGGSICSLRFFQVKTPLEGWSQFGTNLILSAMVSPILVDWVSRLTGFPQGLRLSLPIALGVGVLGCQAVARAIPYAQRWLDRKGDKIVEDA